jgi:hypothetical protein
VFKNIIARLTKPQIKRLTERHIQRYSNFLKDAETKTKHDVNVPETTYYLGIWKSIALKDYEPGLLDATERREVCEAYLDEEGSAEVQE